MGTTDHFPDPHLDEPDYYGSSEEQQVRPVNWNLLTADEARAEWLDLDKWVNWLRRTYGLPPAVLPPFWHRHDELIWELSALHLHWLACYDPDASGSAPLAWHHDFAEARNRLREWVSTAGTRLDHDRPTRQTIWPGEPLPPASLERVIENRDEDFVQFVNEDLTARRRVEQRVDAFVQQQAQTAGSSGSRDGGR
ncbi:MAG: hypothetical protein QM638_15355 [Nocardioides sp.]|uniref:hypothetical protein n=1 Tax=Nocardioides sp. TaxID=35761 RepID=UPI0039E31DA7